MTKNCYVFTLKNRFTFCSWCLFINSTDEKKKTTTIRINYPWRNVKTLNLHFLWVFNVLEMFVFDNNSKRKTFNMAKMIIPKTARAIRILVSMTDCTHFFLIIISIKCKVIIWMHVMKSLCKVQNPQLSASGYVMFFLRFVKKVVHTFVFASSFWTQINNS